MYSDHKTIFNVEQFDRNPCNLFFKKLKPFLLFDKLIGICSMKIFVNLNSLTLERNNFCVIFAIVVRIGLSIYSVMKSICDKQLDIEECLTNASNILATVLCLHTDKILVKMILKIECNNVNNRERNEKFIYSGICICVVLSIHLSRVFDFISPTYLSEREFCYMKFLIIVYHNCTCVSIIIQFLIFISEIQRQFKYLNEAIETTLVKTVVTENNIEICRNLYEELICVVEDLNSSIGLRLLIPIVAIPTDLLAYFYRFVFENKWRLSILDFSMLIIYFFGVHSICSAGSRMKKMSHETFKVLSSISVMGLSSRTHLTIKVFQEHICARPVEISAAGFFNVDKQLITSVLLAITTYCTVILQIVNKN